MHNYHELILMNSKYGWYCHYELLNENGSTAEKDGQWQTGELFNGIPDKETALKKFKKAIKGFGGSEEDISNILHDNKQDSYMLRFKTI